jgi:hypothetical protein
VTFRLESARRTLLVLACAASPLYSQAPPIQDNSFLIEEAYNQERGVVQHISLFSRESQSGNWEYSFTQEWPFHGQRHQLSYRVSFDHRVGPGGPSNGFGDLLLNYRFQLQGDEGKRVWVAPRISVSLPTGRWKQGLGAGTLGVELALPISIEIAPKLLTHLNARLNVQPSARNQAGARATLLDWSSGASAIYLLAPTFNLMLESLVQNASEVSGQGETLRSTTVLLSPGVRWAHNFSSGLQIVPGAGYTIGLGDASDQSGLVLYLSFEHPFKRD